MRLSTSTLTEDHLHPLNDAHHHPNHQQHNPMGYADDLTPGGGEGGGVGGDGGGRGAGLTEGRRPGGFYAMSEFSGSSEYDSPQWNKAGRQGALMLVTFIIELLILVFIIFMEYFLRRQNFTCSDESISCGSRDKQLMAEFAFSASVPDEAVVSLSFCVPAFVVLIGEVGLCTFSEGETRQISLCSRPCFVPLVLRRLLRFLGVFVFGAFSVMVISDVTKMMTGRLRPDFLATCRLNETVCLSSSSSGGPLTLDDSACLNTNRMQLRYARTSFPSFNAALTSYASVFISVYVHGAMRSHSVRVLRPFLAMVFLLLSLLCGLAEYSLCVSHWTDVAVGFALGAALAVYLAVCVLNQFQEHLSYVHMLELVRAYVMESYMPYEDKPHMMKPSELRQYHPHHHPQYYYPLSHSFVHIPRAHMTSVHPPTTSSTTTSAARHPRAGSPEGSRPSQRRGGGGPGAGRPSSAFQRDLSQSLEYHRRHHQPQFLYPGSSSHM